MSKYVCVCWCVCVLFYSTEHWTLLVCVCVCCFTVLSTELYKALTVTGNLYKQPWETWHIIAFFSLKMMVLCRNINLCFLWTVTSSSIFLCSGICPQTALQRGIFACGRQWFTSCCGHQKRMMVWEGKKRYSISNRQCLLAKNAETPSRWNWCPQDSFPHGFLQEHLFFLSLSGYLAL